MAHHSPAWLETHTVSFYADIITQPVRENKADADAHSYYAMGRGCRARQVETENLA
jgi:hypothetical protein